MSKVETTITQDIKKETINKLRWVKKFIEDGETACAKSMLSSVINELSGSPIER